MHKLRCLIFLHFSRSQVPGTRKDEAPINQTSGGQFRAAEMPSHREPPPHYHVAQGQTGDTERWPPPPQADVDAETAGPEGGSLREVHMPGVQQARGHQLHLHARRHR